MNAEKPDGNRVLKNYSRFNSISLNQNQNVKLGDYKVPAKSMNTMVSYELIHNPKLFNSTQLGRNLSKTAQGGYRSTSTKPMMQLSAAPARVAVNVPPTSHWTSTYRNVSGIVASRERIASRRPTWSINRQAYSSARCNYVTEFSDSIGKFGYQPRDFLPAAATKQ